jgi:recombination protein RecR
MTGDPIGELVALLARLPGVGERTATRLAFYVLESEPTLASGLGEAFGELHHRVKRCRTCGNFGADELCHVCRDPRRDASVVCVVARVPDLVAIERSGAFRGRYHVLHGLLAPLDGIHPEHLHVEALEARAEAEGIRELVVATPLTVEGEATALYLADVFADTQVEVTRIASGMPHGGELEFTDQVTLGRALAGRKKV